MGAEAYFGKRPNDASLLYITQYGRWYLNLACLERNAPYCDTKSPDEDQALYKVLFLASGLETGRHLPVAWPTVGYQYWGGKHSSYLTEEDLSNDYGLVQKKAKEIRERLGSFDLMHLAFDYATRVRKGRDYKQPYQIAYDRVTDEDILSLTDSQTKAMRTFFCEDDFHIQEALDAVAHLE